jgi:hypothetical protein
MQGTRQLDRQGLKQLSSSLQQLKHLALDDGRNVTDKALACLSQLKSLTALHVRYCQLVKGSTLGKLAAISGLVSLELIDCGLTTLEGLERLPALQCLGLSDEVEPAQLAPLAALTALTSLVLDEIDITDELIPLLRLPNLARLLVDTFRLTAPPAPGVLQQLTHLQVSSSGSSLANLLPLPQLQDLHVGRHQGAGLRSEDAAALVAAISQQTSLTCLLLEDELSEPQVVQMVAPLKQLQSFDVPCSSAGETSCLAACAALAELPLLRKLTLWRVPQPAHLAMLVRCAQLEELRVSWGEDVGGASTGLLVALVCKPGLRTFGYSHHASAMMDYELLAQVAAGVGVELGVY